MIATLAITSFTGIFFVEPISQDLAYHEFADKRTMLGIKNFFDVASNLPFLLVGILGLHQLYKVWGRSSSWSWLVLFIAIIFVAFGSSYYHLNPENKTLTWDRLPMAVGFMALFVIILTDYISNRLEKWLLVPMVILGIFSVLYWHFTDDLRIYAWVQFVSIAILLITVFVYKSKYLQTKYLLYAFCFYILSKFTEHFDKAIFENLGHFISGHTIKHLLAVIATYFFYKLLKQRMSPVA